MILPENLDLDRPDELVIADLAAGGAYTEDEARAILAMLRDPDAEPVD